MKRATQGLTIVAGGFLLAACASTTFNSTWKAPDAGPIDYTGAEVAALVISKEEGTRRGAEELLARELTNRGAVGIPAYTLVPLSDVKDKDKAKAALEKAGIDGVVALRVVARDKEISSSPSMSMGYWGAPYYGSFWGPGYWGYGWGAVYDPGYLRTDTIVSVETLVYDLKQDKLLWAGMSETTNPKDAASFIKELAGKAAYEMRKQGLIKR